jgi:hypothetical protein
MTEDDITVYIHESEDAELKAQCEAEIKAKVTEPVVTYAKHVGFGHGHGHVHPPYQNRFDDEEWDRHFPVLTDRKQAVLPHMSDLDMQDGVQEMESYYDTKEELEQEVLDAEDEATRAVAVQMLADHKKRGEILGLEN